MAETVSDDFSKHLLRNWLRDRDLGDLDKLIARTPGGEGRQLLEAMRNLDRNGVPSARMWSLFDSDGAEPLFGTLDDFIQSTVLPEVERVWMNNPELFERLDDAVRSKGDWVIQPPPAGHKRVYVPQVHHEQWPVVAEIFSNPEAIDQFASGLARALQRRGLGRVPAGATRTTWARDAATGQPVRVAFNQAGRPIDPDTGRWVSIARTDDGTYDMLAGGDDAVFNSVLDFFAPATSGVPMEWVDSIAQDRVVRLGEDFITPTLMTSGDPNVIDAVNDALADFLAGRGVDHAGNTVRLGYVDVPDDFTAAVGPLDDMGDIMMATTIKPSNRVTYAEVRLEDGSTRWLSVDEIAAYKQTLGVTGGHQILRTVEASGTSTLDAMRDYARRQVDDVTSLLTSPDGEIMTELVQSAKTGTLSANDTLQVPVDHLNADKFRPTVVKDPGMSRWQRLKSGFFSGIVPAAMESIIRGPHFMYQYHEALRHVRGLKIADRFRNPFLAGKVDDLVARTGLPMEGLADLAHTGFNRLDDPLYAGDAWAIAGRALRDKQDAHVVSRKLNKVFDTDVSLTADEVSDLADWMAVEHYATGVERQTTLRMALKNTTQFIDDHRVRSQFQEHVGSLLPFWFAEELFLKRMARSIAQDPAFIERLRLGYQLMVDGGFVTENEFGDKVFVWPLSNEVAGLINGASATVFGQGLMMPTESALSSRLDFIVPGYNSEFGHFQWGPVVGITTDFLANRFPEWRQAQESLFGGETFTGDANPILNTIRTVVPPKLRRLYEATMAWMPGLDGGSEQALARLQIQVLQLLEASGHGLPENASPWEHQEHQDRAREVARILHTVQALGGFVGPASLQVHIPELIEFRKEFFDGLLAAGVPIEDALIAYIEANPDNTLWDLVDEDPTAYTEEQLKRLAALTTGTSEKLTSAPMPATVDDLLWMNDHGDFIESFPMGSTWLLPEEAPDDEFEYAALLQAHAHEFRRRRTPEEFYAAMHASMGYVEWRPMRERYETARLRAEVAGDTAAKAEIDQRWENWEAGFANTHPLWHAEHTTSDGHNVRDRTIEDMRAMLALDDDLIPSPQWPILKPLVEAIVMYRDRMSDTSGLRSTRARLEKQRLRDRILIWAEGYAQDNPTAQRFYDSIIYPELGGHAAELEADARLQGIEVPA